MDDRNNVSRLIIDSVGVGSALPQLSSQRYGDRPTLLATMPMTDTVEVGGIRRTSRVPSGAQPSREEVAMAAEEYGAVRSLERIGCGRRRGARSDGC